MKLIYKSAVVMSATILASCGGGDGGGTLIPTPPVDTTAPAVAFAPSTLTVSSGATAAATLTATDAVGVTTGPTVTCTNGGAFANNTFTAPNVAAQTTSVCTATAGDAAGNTGTGTLTVTINPPDNTNPVVTFAPTTLTVASGGTGSSTLTATDNIGIATGPTVTCTNGGAFASNTFTAPSVAAQTTSVCTATASDAAGNSDTATLTVTISAPVAPPANVDISGTITYDSVPHNVATSGLNYGAITQEPVRGATVEALNSSGAVLDSDVTDASGDYSVTVASNTSVRIQVKAELLSTTGAMWDVKVTDNTNGHALYALQGSLTSSGAANSTRDLNAASGWGGASYTTTRAAAPFAILDPIFEAVTAFAAVDNTVDLPAVEFRWSINNRAESGDVTNGQIGTSSYQRLAGQVQGNVYILGHENNDTDEYDSHVVVHEWGHYFEDRMSRSDSIGGQHSGGDRLDPRVALGEGFGNALSGMILDDPIYRDSSGAMQAAGFSIDVDNNAVSNKGWYNEASVQAVLYDLFDSDDDGTDSISLGLAPIYNVFTAANYTGQPVFTTIFSFITELKAQQPGNDTEIDALLSDQVISGSGQQGTGEVNDGGTTNALPVYRALTVNGAAVQICSNNPNGIYNKLGNRQYLTVNLPSAASYTFTMTRTSGLTDRDPDFNVFQAENFVGRADSSDNNVETLTVNLNAGNHVIDAYDYNNIEPGTPGESCYDFTVTG